MIKRSVRGSNEFMLVVPVKRRLAMLASNPIKD
jgi:hypothetical protein